MFSALFEQWPSNVQNREIIKLGLSGSEITNEIQCYGHDKWYEECSSVSKTSLLWLILLFTILSSKISPFNSTTVSSNPTRLFLWISVSDFSYL